MGEGEIMAITRENTTTATTTAKLFHVRHFDSRSGGKVYAFWTEGDVYAIQADEEILYTGTQLRMCEDYEVVTNPEQYAVDRAYWKEVPFAALPEICIPEVLHAFGPEVIPWSETKWTSYEAYEEWRNPSTLEGKLQLALRKPSQFPREEVEKISTQVIYLGKSGHKLSYSTRTLYQTPWGWYRYDTSYYYTEGYTYAVEQLNEEQAKRLIAQKEEREREEARKKKEYGRHCAVLARKYRLPWKVVSMFKGKEEDVKRFLETLKEAIESKKAFDEWELSCGRGRRSAELERLGIDISHVDPNRIAPYVCECLEEGCICILE